jgi:2-C-methyl-D-erythritol 2,4-cyclodiphosphate synthase
MGYRIGIGHDTHRLGAERPLRLGGVEIPGSPGLVGHSDADALLHAVTDAVLGAAGLGDIGEHFPDTDPANKNADSAVLLTKALALLPAGTRVVNLDCIVHAERPKLSAYKAAIRDRLAELLGVPAARVNVKAKTGERVGPVGRGEALQAEAVALLEIPGD